MYHTINSRIYGKVFFRCSAHGGYLYTRFKTIEKPGDPYDYSQCCYGGQLAGDTVYLSSLDSLAFKHICQRWWKQYVKNNKDFR